MDIDIATAPSTKNLSERKKLEPKRLQAIRSVLTVVLGEIADYRARRRTCAERDHFSTTSPTTRIFLDCWNVFRALFGSLLRRSLPESAPQPHFRHLLKGQFLDMLEIANLLPTPSKESLPPGHGTHLPAKMFFPQLENFGLCCSASGLWPSAFGLWPSPPTSGLRS